MHQRNRLCAFTMASLSVIALSAQDAPTPAVGESLRVAPHYSRWDYPKEVTLPAEAQLHIVEKGDTLWDLGNKYLGNPFAWPKIWEKNKWVKDPHWIYPGDPLVVPAGKVMGDAGQPPVASDDVLGLQPDRRLGGKPVMPEWAFTFQDFIQLPYLAPEGAEKHLAGLKALKIVDSDNPDRENLGDGDRIYLNAGQNAGVKEGSRLLILKVADKGIQHPDQRSGWKTIGDVLQQVGVVRVIQVNPQGSVAVIEKCMDGVVVGDHVADFQEPANVPLKLRTDIAEPIKVGKVQAKVVYCRENHESFGAGDLVIIDKGTKDGLALGNILLAYRNVKWDVDSSETVRNEQTNRYQGQLMVVKEGENYSTCRVLRSVSEMHVGDLLTR
nr:LysM peptidoglycan-binding domain-containing protein [uncultured Holophaga sp.]